MSAALSAALATTHEFQSKRQCLQTAGYPFRGTERITCIVGRTVVSPEAVVPAL